MVKTFIQEDCIKLLSQDNAYEALKGSVFLISGTTGLIGQNVVRFLAEANKQLKLGLKIIAPVRDLHKASRLFFDLTGQISFICTSLDHLVIDCDIDYIIHAASPTSSHNFLTSPVEVISSIYMSTHRLLKMARDKRVKSFLYLSTMEVYGTVDEVPIVENEFGTLDPCLARSSYPESKRLAECLCSGYWSEYNVPVKIARLTQCFGPGVDVFNDNRIFSVIARAVLERKDIILNTKGETERCYVYTADAVSALIKILLYGENGWAYNVANPDTYCSIIEMAKQVAVRYGISVRIREDSELARQFCPKQKVLLNVDRLNKIGWVPLWDMNQAYDRLIWSCRNSNGNNLNHGKI